MGTSPEGLALILGSGILVPERNEVLVVPSDLMPPPRPPRRDACQPV